MTAPGWRAALAELPEHARVVLRVPSGPALAELVGACVEAGVVVVPLDPRTPDATAARIAERVSASLVVDRAEGCGPFSVTRRPGGADLADARGLAVIAFTSGSTGEPKGVMLDRASVAGNAARTADLHGFGPDRPHATCLPLHHVNALVMSLMGCRLRDAELVVTPRFHPDGYFEEIGRRGARTAAIVPALLARLVDARPAWPDCLDYLITAAAPLDAELAGRFCRLYGPRLRQGYGLSEAVNFSATMPLLDAAGFHEQYVARRPPVGLPLDGTRLRIEDGEVLVHTADRMRGYWQDPVATSAVLGADGWLRTGDLGEMRGDYLVIHGRRAETVNRGGEKHVLAAVERAWREAGLTGAFAAVPIDVPGLGQDIGLVTGSGSAAAARTLSAAAPARPLAARSDGLATTSTGKPRRTAMGRALVGRHDNPDRYAALLAYARETARAVVDGPHPPATAPAARLCAHARDLIATTGDLPAHTGDRSAAHDVLDVLVAGWPRLADGSSTGEELMRAHRGLWERLMVEWPMGSYAELMRDVLRANAWLDGRVLEVGTGVGNTTRLIAGDVRGGFVWSDVSAALVRRGRWPGRGIVYDLDADPPDGLAGFDTIVATNVLHCAAHKERTLCRLRSMLAPGGRLVLAEGANPTTPRGRPWALDLLFGMFDGWWDRGGFRTRWEWLDLLERAGFRDTGYGALRAGEHDLGGVVWGAGG